MPFAAALSEHPLPTHAAGEVIGQVLESLGEAPDLAVLTVTGPLVGVMEDVASTVRQLLKPRVLVGATAVSVVGGEREAEEVGAVSLWAGRFAPDARVLPVRITATPEGDEFRIDGLTHAALEGPATLIVMADPFSFPMEGVLEQLAVDNPELLVIGGMASAAHGPGGNRLVIDGDLHQTGAVGVLLGPNVPVTSVVSQGCRPIGRPFVVTRSERNVLYELGGEAAYTRLDEIVASSSAEERALMQSGLHLGQVIDERKLDFGRGDFLVRNLIGGDRTAGAIVAGHEIEIGTTVQFQVRDAQSADEDLIELLDGVTADGALLFTCNGRGRRLFGRPDHDAAELAEHVARAAVGGMFCAGEIGPVGGTSFLHGFTASIALFHEP